MWELDNEKSWMPKNDSFELWCWRRLLRVPWTARRSSQSILKEINPEYSLEGQMLKLMLQYFGHLMWRADSLERPLMLGKIEGRRRRGVAEDEVVGWHHQLNGHEFEQAPGIGEGEGSLACCSPWSQESQTQLSGWTDWLTDLHKRSRWTLPTSLWTRWSSSHFMDLETESQTFPTHSQSAGKHQGQHANPVSRNHCWWPPQASGTKRLLPKD